VTGSSPGVIVGLIANPSSGHDLRRLISGASIATNLEKVNVVRRLLAGLGATGIDRVLMMPDVSGLTLGVERLAANHRVDRDGVWPGLELVEMDVQQTAADTRTATSAMIAAGAGAIVVLGGDGTARAVASVIDDTPLLALSTGTNNAFGVMIDATIAGLAAGLIASGRCPVAEGCERAKRLEVRIGERVEFALVDVAVVDATDVGARAIWEPDALREIVVTLAEPGAIGLSAIAAAVATCSRLDAQGRHLVLGTSGRPVIAPIAPGLMGSVGVIEVIALDPGEPFHLRSTSGVLAFDGEREVVLSGDVPPLVTLSLGGPLVIDVPTVLQLAAERGWFAGAGPASSAMSRAGRTWH
jgi:predicted polyphosphate/ATP-dependent NAD kinase